MRRTRADIEKQRLDVDIQIALNKLCYSIPSHLGNIETKRIGHTIIFLERRTENNVRYADIIHAEYTLSTCDIEEISDMQDYIFSKSNSNVKEKLNPLFFNLYYLINKSDVLA